MFTKFTLSSFVREPNIEFIGPNFWITTSSLKDVFENMKLCKRKLKYTQSH